MNKLTIFDTHCHLADKKYHHSNQHPKEIIQAAEKAGVKHILNVGYDKASNQKVIQQLTEFPSLFGALGLHPNSNEDLAEENLNWIEKQLINQKIIAIGEIGLDYYRPFTEIEKQKYWFKKQLALAKKYDLPVLLHIRGEAEEKHIEVFNETYQIVKEEQIQKGILHCFTGNWEIARKFIELGFYISFAGNITYKKAKWKDKWQEALEKVPLKRLVVETDAPYLTPEPFRGRQINNYPSNIIYTLKKIGEIKQMNWEEIAKITHANSWKLFNLPPKN